MPQNVIDILGSIGATLTTVSTLPQAIETIISRKTEGISILMYILFVAGVALWTVYGALSNNMIVMISNSITFVFSAITLGFKTHNVATGKEPFISSLKKKNEK